MYKKYHLYNSELNTRIVFQRRIELKELYFNYELNTVINTILNCIQRCIQCRIDYNI